MAILSMCRPCPIIKLTSPQSSRRSAAFDTGFASLMLHLHPSLVWVIFLHRRGNSRGNFAQVFLKDLAVVIDDETS